MGLIGQRDFAMRQSLGTFAIIRSSEKNEPTRWLARWNEYWRSYNFVGGHKRADESFRECIIREICEELNLYEGSEFVVAEMAEAHVEYSAWSKSAGHMTEYAIELFSVYLDRSAEEKITRDPSNRWLLESEIRSLTCADDRPVSNTMADLLSKTKLWTEQLQRRSF
jgi:hypothetical protein